MATISGRILPPATDGKAIYMTANMFSHAGGMFQGSRL